MLEENKIHSEKKFVIIGGSIIRWHQNIPFKHMIKE
jgi:hypothetical protein